MNKLNFLTGSVAAVAIFLGGCFCGAAPGQTEASIYLTDQATGRALAGATFTVDGSPSQATCQEHDAQDASRCVSERLVMSPGVHEVGVSAPGYVSETVRVDTSAEDSVHLAVEMKAQAK